MGAQGLQLATARHECDFGRSDTIQTSPATERAQAHSVAGAFDWLALLAWRSPGGRLRADLARARVQAQMRLSSPQRGHDLPVLLL